jgi:glycerol-1-phosphate dehydrogenase [NAD(P)+]
MKLAEMTVNELAGITYECSCGRTHTVDIDRVDISVDAMEHAADYVNELNVSPVTVICDENTYEIAGRDLAGLLDKHNIDNFIHIIEGRNGLNVAPNDACLGETLARINPKSEFYIAVGSGVINDITRQISYKMGTGYMVLATAPSMDGYASVTSSLILNNVKESIEGQYPRAIFGPLDILQSAPYNMLTAGLGDVIGKYNALREWKFGRDYKNEHHCPEIAEMVEVVMEKCRRGAGNLKNRDADTVVNIMEGLVLAGMAMGLYKNTRPASGAEHHIVHYWDVDCIKRGVEHELHGNSVGIGTVVICRLFDLVRSELPVEVDELASEFIIEILKKAGGMTNPQEAGISRELFKESIIKGHTMSSKYTILTYLSGEKPDILESAAETLCEEFYGVI